jgi:hypothetical protein
MTEQQLFLVQALLRRSPMKLAAVFAVLIVAVAGPPGTQGELERIVKDKLKSLENVTVTLKTVTDAKTAAAAVSKMDAALEKLIVCDEVLSDRKMLDQFRKEKLDEKYGKQLTEATKALQKEVERLAKEPNVMKAIEQAAVWKHWQALVKEKSAADEGDRIARAKLDVNGLQTAVTAYDVRHTVYPGTLKELAERQPDGGAALIEEAALKDPWGRQYQFDPNQRHPKTDRPLIWSEGPNPGQAGSKITNWDDKK